MIIPGLRMINMITVLLNALFDSCHRNYTLESICANSCLQYWGVVYIVASACESVVPSTMLQSCIGHGLK